MGYGFKDARHCLDTTDLSDVIEQGGISQRMHMWQAGTVMHHPMKPPSQAGSVQKGASKAGNRAMSAQPRGCACFIDK